MSSAANPQVVTKTTLAQKYGVTRDYLSNLLNKVYFEELETVGYKKDHSNILTPNVVRKFIEVYGEPITTEL